MLPTDVMDRPAWEFWMLADIQAAGSRWEAEQRKKRQQASDTGAATQGEKEDLANDQEARADRREQQDGQPSIGDQIDALNGGDGSPPTDGGR